MSPREYVVLPGELGVSAWTAREHWGMARSWLLLVLVTLTVGCTAPHSGGYPSSPAAPASQSGETSPRGQRTLASGLEVPWDLAVLPGGTALITLRERGEVVLVGGEGEPRVVLDVEGVVAAGEGGLLGIALHPDFTTTGAVYLYVTAEQDNRVVRYDWDGAMLSDPAPILTGIPKSSNHNGGRLRFGPDGLLYIGTGDAGESSLAQDRTSLAGKILRVNPDGSVPRDNPFDSPVYSYGHRNVQGLGWDGTRRLLASEFGANDLDELNVIEAGGNYGWPQAEGPDQDPETVDPLVTWPTSQASPSGIAVAADGTTYVAGLRGERLWRVSPEGEAQSVLEGHGRLRDVQMVGEELWILTNNTARGNPSPQDDRLLVIPLTDLP